MNFISKVIFLLIPLFTFFFTPLIADEGEIDWQKQLDIALNDSSANNRAIAVVSIGDALHDGKIHPVPDSLVDGLIHALHDPSEGVVSDVINALGSSRSSKAQEVIQNMIRNQAFGSSGLEEKARGVVSIIKKSLIPLNDYEVAFRENSDVDTDIALDLLFYNQHEPESVVQILRNALPDNNVSQYMKKKIVQALWETGPSLYREFLHKDLEAYLQNPQIKTQDGKIEVAAILYLVDEYHPEKALSYYQSILEDPNEWKSVKDEIIDVIDTYLNASEKEAFAKKILSSNKIDDPELLEKMGRMANSDSGDSSSSESPPLEPSREGERRQQSLYSLSCIGSGGLTGTAYQIVKTARNISQISAVENKRESGEKEGKSNNHELIKMGLFSAHTELQEAIDNFDHETKDLYKEIIQLTNDINYSDEPGVLPAITRVAEVFGLNEFGIHETREKKIDANRSNIRKIEIEKLRPAIERFNRAYDESIALVRKVGPESKIEKFRENDFEGKYDYAFAKLQAVLENGGKGEDQKKEPSSNSHKNETVALKK